MNRENETGKEKKTCKKIITRVTGMSMGLSILL